MKLTLTISALLYPTESEEKIHSAINALFPNLNFEKTESEEGIEKIIGRGDESNLHVFHRLLREQRILDTVRSVLEARCQEDFFEFQLNKQAATVGAISFPASPEPLGSIHVKIETEDTQHAIDWLTPPTEEGQPVFETDL